MSAEYFACDVSTLFVLLFMVSSFAVPRIAQQKVLLFGIVLALAARTPDLFFSALSARSRADGATRTSPSGARRASGGLDAEATADGLG
jgi:hypothetical protein